MFFSSLKDKIFRNVWKVLGAILFLLVGYGVYYFFFLGNSESLTAGVVVHQVAKGNVSTGITASGKIAAAEILDLNVYTLANRIDVVSVTNGAHVEKGQLLFAFDDSDAAVDVEDAALALKDAELGYSEARLEAGDPNTTIRTLENEIRALKIDIIRNEEKRTTLHRDFLNADLSAESTRARENIQISRTAPTVGGLYTGTTEGEYRIKVYDSSEDSGYSYTYSGIESGVAPVYLGKSAPLGRYGLTITFPGSGSQISPRDEWIIAVPNTYAAEYVENKEAYAEDLETLEKSIAADTVSLANKETQLTQAKRGDTVTHRDVTVAEARLAVEKAQVDLRKGWQAAGERRIVAPFSGTIEGMENVVPGATPTKSTNDPINLGSLISDEFMVTFSLGAKEVNRVRVGGKVLVTLTSLPDKRPLEAEIVEISSLPDSSAVAEYAVRARIQNTEKKVTSLRDGMLADIEIVQEERNNILRIPVLAVRYEEGKTLVDVFENLTDTQKTSVTEMGIIRADESGVLPNPLPREIVLGLSGRYWAEVVSGLSEGEYIRLTSASTAAATSTVVEQRGGFGGGPPRQSTSGGGSDSAPRN